MNKAILVNYLYSDEMDDETMKDSPRCSYIVYADEGTELGKEIAHRLESAEDETDFARLDQVLTEAFGITDGECCFYINGTCSDDIEAIEKEVLDNNDMVVLDVLDIIEEEYV